MASPPFIFSWEVVSAPLEEAEVEYYQTLAQEHTGNYFNVKVHVRHQFICLSTQPQEPPEIIPSFELFSSQDSMLLPCSQFLENGASYMGSNFPHPIIPRELIDTMMPEVTTYAKNMLENCSPSSYLYEIGQFRLLTLVLDIVIQKLYDADAINMITEGSMRQVRMVPASKTAIESLEKVKLEKDAAMESCSICLVEFVEGVEVSTMPCKHMHHQECITQWLETSHICPLCRYSLPHV